MIRVIRYFFVGAASAIVDIGLFIAIFAGLTVPLCAIHHAQNHSTGDEKLWWEKHNIDPLEIARKLWDESRKNLWPPALVR
jgi:hypothetical protein